MNQSRVKETEAKKIELRPASEVMQVERLGAFRMTYLSFSRAIIRKVMKEQWNIERISFNLNREGYGEAIYRIKTLKDVFTFFVISHELNQSERSDRVISEKWDVTFALCEGIPSKEKLDRLRKELPKQEYGRGDVEDLVWSRANKSERMFHYFVESLANEQQPDPEVIAKVGYLLRTTAVYGNGKFGIASYEKIKENHPFNGSFRAQMFSVYMLRHFSFEMVEHIAQQKNSKAVTLNPEIKRYIGTGNATGLGMVPFLINHPKLIHQWIFTREKAIARVKGIKLTQNKCKRFIELIENTIHYFSQMPEVDLGVFISREMLIIECTKLKELINEYLNNGTILGKLIDGVWEGVTEATKKITSMETQEVIHSLLMELYAEYISELEDCFDTEEKYAIVPEMNLHELTEVIDRQYSWVSKYNFNDPKEKYYFWYRSVEKEEPRIGIRGQEPGDDCELHLNIAEQVQELYELLKICSEKETVADFLLRYPKFKGIIKRVQSLNGYEYGEIRCNLLAKNLLPIYLLRCKLSFFGAEKFDPKSNRWVRITLFQGAPLVEDIGKGSNDAWLFPQQPILEENK